MTKKILFLLTVLSKRKLFVLFVMMFIGLIFEMMSLGILIPLLTLMLNTKDLATEYPWLQPYLKVLGNPTQIQLVVGGMIFLVIFYLIKSVFLISLSWRQGKLTAHLTVVLGRNLLIGYLRQPYMFHLQRNSAELFRNINSEINQFCAIVYNFLTIILELSAATGIVAMLIYREPVGAISMALIILVFALLFHRITRTKLIVWGNKRQHHAGLLYKHLLQSLSGVKDVKLLGREKFFLNEFDINNSIIADVNMKNATLGFIPRLYFEFLAISGLAGIVILMVIQNKPMDLFIPTIGLFVASAFRIIPSVTRVLNSAQQIRSSSNAVDLLYNEFHIIGKNKNPEQGHEILSFAEKITLNEIQFQYTGAHNKAIRGITLQINRGESIGFIGPSGSGKSTLADIILGLLPPESGEILIDGKNIQQNLRSWQNQIGYVPQSIYLTDDSLKNNVAFGIPDNEIDIAAVTAAITAAQMDEFVNSLPDGLDTFVGERGIRLSGGQRQRIGIARALYHKPSVLVLDEATSALDVDTEKEVMQTVRALQGEKTILIVAHRLSTVAKCNRIYKLNHGEIISEGVPKDVLSVNQV